jgi:hypothetical protein
MMISLKDAYDIVNSIVPADEYVSISMQANWFILGRHVRESTPQVEFRIYRNGGLGEKGLSASTLDAAVAKFVAEHSSFPITASEVEDVIADAMADDPRHFSPFLTHDFEEKCSCGANFEDIQLVNHRKGIEHEPTGRCYRCDEVKDDPIHTKETL